MIYRRHAGFRGRLEYRLSHRKPKNTGKRTFNSCYPGRLFLCNILMCTLQEGDLLARLFGLRCRRCLEDMSS